jgi:hypothetical protein
MEALGLLGTGKKVIDYVFQLTSASSESREEKKYIEQFESELDELCYLTRLTWPHLDRHEQHRVQRVIFHAEQAIRSIAEPNNASVRDMATFGTVTIYRRVLWTLRDSDAIQRLRPRLEMSHMSVSREITALQSVAQRLRQQNTVTIYADDHKEDAVNGDALWEAGSEGTAPQSVASGLSSRSKRHHRDSHNTTDEDVQWLGEHFARRSHRNSLSPAPEAQQDHDLAWIGQAFSRSSSVSEDVRPKIRHSGGGKTNDT